MTTGKTIALTRQTFVDKVMSLLFNMLSRFLIAFLPRSKHLLVSWLQSPSAVILQPKKKSLIQSAGDLQDPYPLLYPGYESGLRTLFNVSSPWSRPVVLIVSPTLINFTHLSFCLMSGNCFPTRAWPRQKQLRNPGQGYSLLCSKCPQPTAGDVLACCSPWGPKR